MFSFGRLLAYYGAVYEKDRQNWLKSRGAAMTTACEVVNRLMKAVAERDIEGIERVVSDETVYEPIPTGKFLGTVAIVEVFRNMYEMADDQEIVVHKTAEGPDGIVFNERTDRFLVRGKWIDIRCIGVFEVGGGKISAWRGYFDLQQFNEQIAQTGIVLPAVDHLLARVDAKLEE